MSHSSVRTHVFEEGLSFQKFLFSGAKEKTKEKKDFLFAKKLARNSRHFIYAHPCTHPCTHNSRANKSFCFCEPRARARENRKREREILFFLCLFVCVCV